MLNRSSLVIGLLLLLVVTFVAPFVKAEDYCVSPGMNVRWAPCGGVAFVSQQGMRGNLLAKRWESCLGGNYEWINLQLSGGGIVWVANVNGNSVVPCGGGDIDLSGSLQDVVNRIGNAVGARSPRTDISITVRNLNNGNYAEYRGNEKHVSASAAKAMWVGAALKGTGIGPVSQFAGPIFRNSDNTATGQAIDLIGPNAVNDYYRAVGMKDSGFSQWGSNRVATNSPRAMGADNYFTSNDCVRFLEKLANNQVPYAEQLRAWMTWAPRSGVGGWLAAKLPSNAHISHKGGWLPPGSTSSDALYNTLTEVGIVTAPNGVRYAVAILARRGSDWWGAQTRYVEWASCAIYSKVTGQILNC